MGTRPDRHGRRFRWKEQAPGPAGYTLIELSAVLAIALALMLAGVATIRSVRKAGISTAAQRLSASVRYLADLAVVTNRPYRLVLDLSAGAWWGEPADPSQGCGTALLPSREEMREQGKSPTEETSGEPLALPTASMLAQALASPQGIASLLQGGAPAAAPPEGPPPEEGTRPKGEGPRLLKRTELAKGLEVFRVMTSHQMEPTEEGKAEVYFFPSGYVEAAYLYLRRDDEVYTVETIPLMGTARVHHEELDPGDLLDRVSREGR